MGKELTTIICKTKANDVDEKGVLTLAVNGIGIKDADGDVSCSGSFTKTIGENFNRCKWFLNHNKTQLLGVPIEGKEEDGNLVMIGKINLKKQIGTETYEDYKLYAEYGKTLEHSVGVKAIKRDPVDSSKVLEWYLGEYSTLTHWGANPQTFMMDIKELKGDDLAIHIQMMHKALNGKYSGEKLKSLENNLFLIKKAILGENIVQCSHCGLAFDYNTVPEESLETQVLEAAGNYARWITEDAVYTEMQKLKPEIQERVLNIINQNKSLDDLASYVRCPKCYSRIYRSNTLVEPSEDTQQKEESRTSTFTLKSIAGFNI